MKRMSFWLPKDCRILRDWLWHKKKETEAEGIRSSMGNEILKILMKAYYDDRTNPFKKK